MLECHMPVDSPMFIDTGVKQRFPLPVAFNIGRVRLPIFLIGGLFACLFLLSVLLCSLLSGLSCGTYMVRAKGYQSCSKMT